MPELVPIQFIYTSSADYLTNFIVLEPKISKKLPVLANFRIFLVFLGVNRTKHAGNADLCQAQVIATPFLLIPHLGFWPGRFGATFNAQKCCFSQLFDT